MKDLSIFSKQASTLPTGLSTTATGPISGTTTGVPTQQNLPADFSLKKWETVTLQKTTCTTYTA